MFEFVPGATCPDGKIFVPRVNGSEWEVMDASWNLVGCPAGYSLISEQCEMCPGGAYCSGGSIPATPCGAALYTLPGAKSATMCYPAVFVIVTTAVPIFRSSFTDEVGVRFQTAMASVCGLKPGYVVIQGVVGDKQTSVSCSIATPDAKYAAELAQFLSNEVVQSGMDSRGFPNSSLETVKVTGCLPGFELTEAQVCQLCPAASFCLGGSSPSIQCSVGYYAVPGSNSSSACKAAVFVIIVISLPMSRSNFTEAEMARLETAIATAASISVENVFVAAAIQGRRVGSPSIQVTAEIAAINSDSAESIVSKLDSSILTQCLTAQGFPESSLQSVTISTSSPVANQGALITIIVAAIVAILIILSSCGAFLLLRKIESEDDRLLRRSVDLLRVNLRITTQDGYYLRYIYLMQNRGLFLSPSLSFALSAPKLLPPFLASLQFGFPGAAIERKR